MNLYGPTAATGIGGSALLGTATGTQVFWYALAAFTIIGAIGALGRIAPKMRFRKR